MSVIKWPSSSQKTKKRWPYNCKTFKLWPDRDRHIVVPLQNNTGRYTDLYGVEKHEVGMGEKGEIFPQRLYIV
jgi:hypothetical protein